MKTPVDPTPIANETHRVIPQQRIRQHKRFAEKRACKTSELFIGDTKRKKIKPSTTVIFYGQRSGSSETQPFGITPQSHTPIRRRIWWDSYNPISLWSKPHSEFQWKDIYSIIYSGTYKSKLDWMRESLNLVSKYVHA